MTQLRRLNSQLRFLITLLYRMPYCTIVLYMYTYIYIHEYIRIRIYIYIYIHVYNQQAPSRTGVQASVWTFSLTVSTGNRIASQFGLSTPETGGSRTNESKGFPVFPLRDPLTRGSFKGVWVIEYRSYSLKALRWM